MFEPLLVSYRANDHNTYLLVPLRQETLGSPVLHVLDSQVPNLFACAHTRGASEYVVSQSLELPSTFALSSTQFLEA